MEAYSTAAIVFGVIFWIALAALGIYFAVIMSGGKKKILSIVFAAFGVLFPVLETVPIAIGASESWD
jgi:uncharacterized membrane protein